MGSAVFLLVFAAIFEIAFCGDNYIVATKQGRIEGKLSSNALYYEFFGITYGVPVKFKSPSPPPKISGVFKADVTNVVCPQFPSNDMFALPSDTEDCLLLNIFTPTSFTSNNTYPVMVYLHGGDFGVGSGSPSFYGPHYLLSHGVVLVTLNYRLNAYGFLNLGTEDAPGNAGLKDIRAALRWIKENIANFGGDPNNVTVFGQGSGGIAAIYLTLSKSTKGLFHKIISQSGAVFSPQSFDPNPFITASQVAKTLGVNTLDPEELLKVFKDTPISKVEEAIFKQMHQKSVFVPSVEDIFEGEEPFLTDTPFSILNAGSDSEHFNPVPTIIGVNTIEGLTCTLDYNTISALIYRMKHDDLSILDQRSMIVPEEELKEFRRILNETYFSNGTNEDDKIVGGLINLISDFSFVGPMGLYGDLLANKTSFPVFQYVFDYVGNRNLGRLLTNASLPATTNMDELIYLFELNRLPLPMDENDARILTFMTTMWTNFAKFGNPTPESEHGEWISHPHHLAILLEPKYVAPLTPDRSYFWRTLYYKYGADIFKY